MLLIAFQYFKLYSTVIFLRRMQIFQIFQKLFKLKFKTQVISKKKLLLIKKKYSQELILEKILTERLELIFFFNFRSKNQFKDNFNEK